jgi:hypothetical protein
MQKTIMYRDTGLCIRQIKQLRQSTGLVKWGSVAMVSEIVKEIPSLQWNETKTSPDEIPVTHRPPPKNQQKHPVPAKKPLQFVSY